MNNEVVLCEVGKKMCIQKLVVACDGNISFRRKDGNIVITPSGYPKGELTPDMLVVIDAKGNNLSNNFKPSTEMNMHLAIYRLRPDVNAIVHAHPPVATAVTVAGTVFPNNIVTEGRDFLGPVATVPYEDPASEELAQACAKAMLGHNVILMANHGATTVGKNLKEAGYRMETLEAVASIYRDALSMNTALNEKPSLSLLKK